MKRTERRVSGILWGAALGGLLLTGCAKHQGNAAAALQQVDAACAKQDQEGARRLLREEAEKNPLFREAYEKSKENWKVKDDGKVNPCGLLLADLKQRLSAAH